MCNSTDFKFCTCLKRDVDLSQPHWVLYSAQIVNEPSIRMGVISRRLPQENFDFDEFEKIIETALLDNSLFDFEYKPQHLDLVHVIIPHLNFKVTFQHYIFSNSEYIWSNFNYSFDSLYDFKIRRLTQGRIDFNS